MQRIALGLEYDGSAYYGWQTQKELISVQKTLENAITKIALEPISVVAAGRTDTNVHALGQVVHFDTQALRPMDAWLRGVNTYLPKDIRVRWAKVVDSSFHARFSALKRRYIYLMTSDKVSPAHNHQGVTWLHYPIDEVKMAQASKAWLGTHDFSSFRASGCQANSPIRTIHQIDVYRSQDLVCIEVTANAFLHHMVRNMVGTLLMIGKGSKPVGFSAEVLAAKQRQEAPQMAPAQGLYLAQVVYPIMHELPDSLNIPWFFPKLKQCNAGEALESNIVV